MGLVIEPRVADAAPSRRVWRRFVVFGIAVMIAVTALGARLFQLTVVDTAQFQSLAVRQQQGSQAVPVTRGLIYDRKGRKLVENVPIFVVRVRPGEIPYPMRDAVVERLAQLLGTSVVDVYETIDRSAGSPYDPVTIAEEVPTSVARVIAEEHLGLPGVSVDVMGRRKYLYGPLLAPILGWTGRVSADDYQELRSDGYLAGDTMGKQGVEATFERELRGQYGVQQVQRDAAGRVVSVLKTLTEPEAGASLQLTIDVEIQREAEKALEWGMKAAGLKRGVFIVMDPQNGEVLAMVSLPAYDNNDFAGGISAAAYRKLLKDPHKPLLNLAISEQLPPGSTYKLVTSLGALQDRKISSRTRLMTRGYILVAGTKMRDWNPYGFGSINIYDGFAHSSDTFYYQVALKLGIDRLGYWAHEMGFGRKTGIDLPGETVGTVPTNDWKMGVFSQPIYPGETAQAGIGQGYVAVTPIQLITAFSALANGGTLYRPQLVRKLLDSKGRTIKTYKPEITRKLPVDAGVLRTMRVASRNVLVSRHTLNFVDLPVVSAGKSGTAEYSVRDSQGRLPFHSWFVGFTPKDARKKASDPNGFKASAGTDSQLAFLAFAFDSRTRGNAGTEIAKYFLQLHYGVKKDYRNRDLLVRDNFYGQ